MDTEQILSNYRQHLPDFFSCQLAADDAEQVVITGHFMINGIAVNESISFKLHILARLDPNVTAKEFVNAISWTAMARYMHILQEETVFKA